ncbi:MAG: hypothetical protein K5883_04950 [Pseudobutyrivibrio sp.]|nr:hypothetical protein [Pseudobutyrivibrio sp.]
MRKIKYVSLLMTMVLCIGAAQPVFAAEIDEQGQYSLEQFEAEYGITENEIINFENNFESALIELENTDSVEQLDGSVVKTVPVSENLVLEVITNEESDAYSVLGLNQVSRAQASEKTITSKLSIKNVYGIEIVTLNAVGKYSINGTISKPIDAYGTHNAYAWDVTTVGAAKGPSAYNAWVRVSFSSQFNFGVDPVSMTIQSRDDTCTIYCNAKGTYSASWQ